jgi:Molybdenum Cofactor Synthesis C
MNRIGMISPSIRQRSCTSPFLRQKRYGRQNACTCIMEAWGRACSRCRLFTHLCSFKVLQEQVSTWFPEVAASSPGTFTVALDDKADHPFSYCKDWTWVCDKLRLTCEGKLRPCLGSHLEFDIKTPMRNGASDEQLVRFFGQVVEGKPEQHDFWHNYQPGRQMVAVGG